MDLLRPGLAGLTAANASAFLREILAIVPPVMILMGLFDVWTPRELVENHLGPGAGPRGIALALLLVTAAAGPLYAAFPLAVALGLLSKFSTGIWSNFPDWAQTLLSDGVVLAALAAFFLNLLFNHTSLAAKARSARNETKPANEPLFL